MNIYICNSLFYSLGIRINTICPGVVRTKMAELFWKDETLSKELSNRVFLKRHGDPVRIKI